ncbi:ABC transporter permease [Streptomyces sp. 4503]|uniref:ABC transporter permease n=1 Tax=Streptomyces niphimycinicus TaxID=2842201 RepID=A0ABS6CNQ3_9ACTN|nr:ABC transporter permease [Streptomyces niphimycinicus]MBU3868562.1 ABC transporter permease [Streptomyces niphimycinicus]
MTAPLTPHDPPPPHEDPAEGRPPAHGQSAGDSSVPNPSGYPEHPSEGSSEHPSGHPGGSEYSEHSEYSEPGPELRAELVQASLVAIAVAVSGVLLGLLWLWLAPKVPLVSDGTAVYLKNSEGEDAIGADGVFTLLGLAFGAVSALIVFLLFRHGGIALVIGLAIGGVLASVIAWRLGLWLGPTSDVVAHAKEAGKGVTFDGPLKLGAKGALLAWSVAAMVIHLALTGLFGPRDPEPALPSVARPGAR